MRFRSGTHCDRRTAAAVALACLLGAGLLSANVVESRSAFEKVGKIETGRVASGSRVFFSAAELNAFMREEARSRVPGGVRDLRFSLANNRATGYAMVDFVKLRQTATGQAPGWVAQNLFAGERPVAVTARLSSQNGKARVDVERVEVSGVPIYGRALDFLIDDYVKPMFPGARVSEWFAMGYQVDRLDLSPAGMTVVVKRR